MRIFSLTFFGSAAAMALVAAGAAYSQNADRRGLDANADGNITRAEATAAAEARFARADANADGQLTAADRAASRERRSAEMFSRLDADNNGSISRAEWDARGEQMRERRERIRESHRADGEHRGHGMRGMGGREQRAMRMMRSADSNNDQAIDRAEFTAVATRRFDAIDSNNDGIITAAERDAYRVEMRQRMREAVRTRINRHQNDAGDAVAAPSE